MDLGVSAIDNPHDGVLNMILVTPEGKRHIDPKDAKTYGGVITMNFASWLASKYKVKLEKLDEFYIVKYPHDISAV